MTSEMSRVYGKELLISSIVRKYNGGMSYEEIASSVGETVEKVEYIVDVELWNIEHFRRLSH